MATSIKTIVTNDKDDIVTGFDITADVDIVRNFSNIGLYDFLIDEIGYDAESCKALTNLITEKIFAGYEEFVDKAVEIFHKHATLSRWSGNMEDNSIVGVSGKQLKKSFGRIEIDVRIGVNTNEISNTANWRHGKRGGWKYLGKYMKPGVDYSIGLESGAAHRRNPAVNSMWEGFVERADKELDNIVISR